MNHTEPKYTKLDIVKDKWINFIVIPDKRVRGDFKNLFDQESLSEKDYEMFTGRI